MKIKPSKRQMKILKKYHKLYQKVAGVYWKSVHALETEMSEETGIDELVFFKVDGDYVGIGNIERTLKLIHFEDLE